MRLRQWAAQVSSHGFLMACRAWRGGGVFVFSKFHLRKRLAMCLHRCSAPGAQGREAVWPAKLRALPRPRLLSLQPSCKWSNHKGHGSLDLCLASTLNRSPTPQCCPSCGSPPQAAPFTPTASSATQNPPPRSGVILIQEPRCRHFLH